MLKAAYNPTQAPVKPMGTLHLMLIMGGLVALPFWLADSCKRDSGSSGSYSSTQSDLESKERSLERGDRLIYGDIRVESKEDIEKAAKEWQKEEKEGIGQHY